MGLFANSPFQALIDKLRGKSGETKAPERLAAGPTLPYGSNFSSTGMPGTADIQEGLYGDWTRASEFDRQNFLRRRQALSELKGSFTDSTKKGTDRIAGMEQAGLADVTSMRDALLGSSSDAASAALSQYSGALASTRGATGTALATLAGEQRYLSQMRAGLSSAFTKALSDARDQSAAKQASWEAGQSAALRQSKQRTAAQLAEAGYSPKEIKYEMGRLDYDSTVQRASQMGAFQVEEQERMDQLRLQYSSMLSQVDQSIAGIRSGIAGQMAQVGMAGAEAETRIADLSAKVGQWKTSVDQATRLGALDAAGQYRFSAQQFQSALDAMAMQGYTTWAGMEQDLEAVFTPYAPILMQQFGVGLMLEDRNYGYEGSGIALLQAGAGMMQATANSLIGQVKADRTSEEAPGMT